MPSIIKTLLQNLAAVVFSLVRISNHHNIFPFGLSHSYTSMHLFQPIRVRVAVREQQSEQGHPNFPLLGHILHCLPWFLLCLIPQQWLTC